MAITGWKSPGTCANVDRDGKVAWTNPDNVKVSDNTYAVCDAASMDYGDWLRCTNFGFTIADVPVGSSVDGIEVSIERQGEGAAVTDIVDSALYLRDAGGQAGDNKADAVTNWPVNDAAVVYGGVADDWNAGLDDTEVIAATFGVDFSIYNEHATQPRHGDVDHIQIRITYTAPGVGGGEMTTNTNYWGPAIV